MTVNIFVVGKKSSFFFFIFSFFIISISSFFFCILLHCLFFFCLFLFCFIFCFVPSIRYLGHFLNPFYFGDDVAELLWPICITYCMSLSPFAKNFGRQESK